MSVLQLQNLMKKIKDTTSRTTTPVNWHEDFIVHLARVYRPKVYVELGLYQCVLFNRMIPYAEKLIGVDTVPEDGTDMIESV